MQTTPASQRTRLACDPCRAQKRKCNGHQPCSNCTRYGYTCSYAARPSRSRQQRKKGNPDVARISPAKDLASSVEANSGLTLPRILSNKAQGTVDRSALQPFGWNLGLRNESSRCAPLVTQCVTKIELQGLAVEYFMKFHPLYPFLEPDLFYKRLDERWLHPEEPDAFDGILCGAAALGALFAQAAGEREENIVRCARSFLEASSTLAQPRLDHVAAWLLRCFYLRMAAHPHVCWIATCQLLHLVEATSLHHDAPGVSISRPDHSMFNCDAEYKRRMYWLAIVINTLASYESGRQRVVLRGVTCRTPETDAGDFLQDIIFMHGISDLLDPERDASTAELERGLASLEARWAGHGALVLIKTHQAFCIYRRLLILGISMKQDLTQRIIKQGKDGVKAALDLVQKREPWWHVANVPFQFLCLLLAIDTREAMTELRPALDALDTVAAHFPTQGMRDTLGRAEQLLRLFQNRKEEEGELFAQVLAARKGRSIDSDEPWVGTATHEQLGNNTFDMDWNDLSNMTWDAGLFPYFSDAAHA